MTNLAEHWRYKWALWHLARGDARPMQVLTRRWIRQFQAVFEEVRELIEMNFTPAMAAVAKAMAELGQALPRRDDDVD